MRSLLGKVLGLVVLAAIAVGAVTSANGQGSCTYNNPAGCNGKPALKLTIKKGQTLKGVKRKGVKVQASCSIACRVTLTARKGKKALGKKTKSLASGTGTITVKLTKKGKRALKGKKARVTVSGVATTAANQKSKTVKTSKTLK